MHKDNNILLKPQMRISYHLECSSLKETKKKYIIIKSIKYEKTNNKLFIM